MSRPIVQSVTFSASAQKLYALYIDPKKHAAFTGAKVSISSKSNSKFSAFGGLLLGQTLCAIPGRLIVQRWRAAHWPKTDPDSILVLTFTPVGKKARIDLVHISVPDHDQAGVTKGWKIYYWGPLKKYLRTGKSQFFSPQGM